MAARRRARLLFVARFSCLLWLPLLLFALACSSSEVGPPDLERPNVVLIIGDDHGYPDFGFMGSPYVETPYLDRLAEEGTLFTHAHNTGSVCRPSLRSLLTGLYPSQFGARTWRLKVQGTQLGQFEFIREFVTLPRLLGQRGYVSFQAGKFWEADYQAAGFTDGMQKPGDDPSYGGMGRWLGRKVPLDPVYAFVEANRDRPFFLWFAPMLPHTPHDAPWEYQKRYRGQGLSTAAVLYYANITRFDDLVGQLLEHLEERGLRERTLVVYLADNGWDQDPHESRGGLWGGSRGKQTVYELGLRTPLIFSWPGVVPAGVVSDALVSTVDLFPTLLDYAGAAQRPERPGRSLRPLIEEGAPWERDRIIGRPSKVRVAAGPALAKGGDRLSDLSYFLRTRDWWYIWYLDRDVQELYDLRNDPRATSDVSHRHPDLIAEFRDAVREWDEEMRRPFEAPGEPGED